MRRLVLALGLLVVVGKAVYAEPRNDALQVLKTWTAAFSASDVDTIVGLYSPDALFIGTGSKSVVVTQEGVRSYFEAALLTNKPRGASLDAFEAVALSDTAVVISGTDTITGVRDGKVFSVHGRVSFVVAKRGSEWKIVQFHRSAMPT